MDAVKNAINYPIGEAAEEAYKVLRSNVQFLDMENKIKTLAITSYSPGEGKSTTSINLGIAMAKAGAKVLYIDADIRKPMPFKFLMSNNLKGLTNFLLKQVGLEDITNSTNIEGFDFITCGIKTGNPSELILSDKFNELLQAVGKLYDIVIIDTPPIGSVIDGAIIASKADATILVIEVNTVKCKHALAMKNQLEKASAYIIGVVLNKINKADYRHYYGSYDYYGTKKKYIKK